MPQMTHSLAVQLRESVKIYPLKHVKIQGVNISGDQIILSVLLLFTVSLNLGLLVFSVEV